MMKIQRVEIEAFVHATEDSEKVMSCLRNLVPFEFEPMEEKTEGHFGNPITILKVKITRQKEVSEFIGFIRGALPKNDKAKLVRELETRLEGNKLYLRLDKMLAFEGKTALGEGVQAALTVTSYPYDRKGIIKGLKELFS